MTTITEYRQEHTRMLVESGAIRTSHVEHAFTAVPRHRFVGDFFVRRNGGLSPVTVSPEAPSDEALREIYGGSPLVTHTREGRPTSSSSASMLVAHMLEALRLEPHLRVLEIGTGTGYNAALLAELVGAGNVVTVESQADVAREAAAALVATGYGGIEAVHGDGFDAIGDHASFDRIVVTVGCTDFSPHWERQLADAGMLLVPYRHAGANPLVSVSRTSNGVVGTIVGMSGFMPIEGRLEDPQYFGSSGSLPDFHSWCEGAERHDLWPGLQRDQRAGQAFSWDTARIGFWVYLGFVDRRTAVFDWSPWSFGLVGKGGNIVSIVGDEIAASGNGHILDELAAHYDAWQGLGAPKPSAYTLRFSPRGPDAGSQAVLSALTVRRGNHYQVAVHVGTPG